MKSMTLRQFKLYFSEVIKEIKNGGKIAITFGRKKEIVGYFMSELSQNPKRNLGILEGKVEVAFIDDFKITEEEFLKSRTIPGLPINIK